MNGEQQKLYIAMKPFNAGIINKEKLPQLS